MVDTGNIFILWSFDRIRVRSPNDSVLRCVNPPVVVYFDSLRLVPLVPFDTLLHEACLVPPNKPLQ